MQISRTTLNSWFPDVIADQTGRVHIVWSSHEDGYDAVFYNSLLPDQGWTIPTDVFAEYVRDRQIQEATRPALALDNKGNLLMTNRVLNIYFSMVPASFAGEVAAWTEPAAINTQDTSYFSRLAVDSNDTYHAFITQNVSTQNCPICMHLFYRRSKDGGKTWSPAQDISWDSNGVAKPQVVVDANDNLHLIWEAGVAGGTLGQTLPPNSVYYAVSRDGGDTWSDPLALGLGSIKESYRYPAIGVDGKQNLVAAWLKLPEDVVYYQISQDAGANWSAPTKIAGLYGSFGVRENRLDSYTMATDVAGNVHLAVVGRASPEQKQLGLYHTIWDGQSWSQPQAIHPPSEDAPVWPRLAIGLGNHLHVVYALNTTAGLGLTDGDENARLDIYYSQNLLSMPEAMPAVAPISYPTPTPVPTAVPELFAQSAEPTALAITDRIPSTVDYQSLRTEVDDYGMLLLSGVPVVLLFLGAFFIVRRRRP